MPVRNVVPKSLQKPHPPLWVACSRHETIHLAAQKGIGALTFSFVEAAEAKAWVDDYYSTIASEECVPGGFAVNPNVAIVLPMMIHPDEAQAIDRGLDGAHFFGYSLAHYYVFGAHEPGRTKIVENFERDRDRMGFSRKVASQTDVVLGAQVLEQGLGSLRGAIGTPDQVRDLLKRYEAAGVDQVIFISQAGANRHEHICESIELFASDVLPEFRAEQPARAARKQKELAPFLEAALARKQRMRPLRDDEIPVVPASVRKAQVSGRPLNA
jgi:alkanesulfonate monooxygenase SsuD/methylene tetrahydromethanopterin reductase-like flavin-dependent oxidoreductase (luciferase family)